MPDTTEVYSREDPLEEEMATHSRILAWEIQWTQDPGGLQAMGSQKCGTGLATIAHDLATSNRTEPNSKYNKLFYFIFRF